MKYLEDNAVFRVDPCILTFVDTASWDLQKENVAAVYIML